MTESPNAVGTGDGGGESPPAELSIDISTSTLTFHEEVLERILGMRPMQASVAKLATVIADEESSIDEVEGIIRSDPSLATALLREANSAASAPTSEITTISAAVTRLGLARVLAIAVGSMVGPEIQGELDAYQLVPGGLWRQSLIASYVAEAIYRVGVPGVGPETVTAALLHHVGLVILDEFLDARIFAAARAANAGPQLAERELIDLDHAEVGAALLEKWGLPRAITEPVRWHHRPREFGTAPVYAVCVASALADEIINGQEAGDEPVEPIEPDPVVESSLEVLKLSRSTVLEGARVLLGRAGLDHDLAAL